ncbi:TIGR01244 family sulfur transferase [Thalassospiraceae bacterium LMO-JJ14]|nr:TIGR01244 family sulfur transferase [Thalassospiraceae bacterium LMO-JJ14]
MLENVSITPEFTIGPQVTSEDFDALRAAGFASVLNLRPDDEIGTYLLSHDAERLAHANGLAYAHSPTEGHEIFEPDVIDRFERAVIDLPAPIFAHCKSGMRAAILWALAAARHRDVEDVIATLQAAGQELDFLEDELRESAREVSRSPFRLKDDALLSLGRSNLFGGRRAGDDNQ